MKNPSSQWKITSAAGARACPPFPPHLFPLTPFLLHLPHNSRHCPPTFPGSFSPLHPRLRPPRPTSIATMTLSTTSSITVLKSVSRRWGSGSMAVTPSLYTGPSPGCIRYPSLGCPGRSAAGHLKQGRSTVSWEVHSKWGTVVGLKGAGRKVVCIHHTVGAKCIIPITQRGSNSC